MHFPIDCLLERELISILNPTDSLPSKMVALNLKLTKNATYSIDLRLAPTY